MYTVDINSDEPIMLLNKHIGFDSEDGMGIDGSLFQQELLQLDSMGKKRIVVWINSPGGNVMDGYNIFSAISKTKTPVDTYNCGVAASIAGVIFMAGRKRTMADYASLMIHPPSGSSDKKAMESFRASLITALSANANVSEDEVGYLMDSTTWLNAAECFAKGFCNEIEATSEQNKKRMKQASDVKAMFAISNSIKGFTTITNKSIVMTKVTMKLGLNDAATEDNVVSAIKEIEDKAYNAEVAKIAAENKVKEIENATKAEKEDLAKKLKEAEDAKAAVNANYDKLKAEYDAMVTDKLAAEKATLEVKAKNMVEGYAKAGRIKNEASVILKWTNKAVENYEETEELIKDLPLSKEAPKLEIANQLKEGELPTSTIGLMVKNRQKREGKI